MKKRKTVFCEMGFLNKFLRLRPTMLEADTKSICQMECWGALYKFLCKSDITIDISKEEFSKLADKDSWLAMLWKKSAAGECGLEFNSEKFIKPDNVGMNKLDDVFLNALFLTDKEEVECEKFSDNYGTFALNGKSIMECSHLFKDNGCAFPSETAKDWSFLSALNGCHPRLNVGNSLIIVDNYLFESNSRETGGSNRDVTFDFEDKIDFNLKPILDYILPQKLADDLFYEISIISGRENINYESQYNYVRSTIRKLRPKLNFKLSFYNNASIFHDRCIVSNNVWISCGHGFDIFKKEKSNPSKSTTVNVVFPFIQSNILWADDSFLNLMKDAKKIILRFNEEGKNYWGDNKGKCRIMSCYCESGGEKASDNDLVMQDSTPFTIGRLKCSGKIDLSKIPKR